MADDLILQVRQLIQYPNKAFAAPDDALLLQEGGLGGPYRSITPPELISTALADGGWLLLKTGEGLAWTDRATFVWDGTTFQFDNLVTAPEFNATNALFERGKRVATFEHFEWLAANSVLSINNRTGHVQIEQRDILRAGGAPVRDAHFVGHITAPTVWDVRQADDTVATTSWVQQVLCAWLNGAATTSLVTSFNGRHGDVVLTAADITAASQATPGDYPRSQTPPFGDVSTRIATTAFVDESVEDLRSWVEEHVQGQQPDLSGYALLASPQFSGVPTAPTAAAGSSTGQLATTAFVAHAVTAATAGVASFNTRTGAVVLSLADITGAGGAPLASPAFTGTPTAPTPPPGNSSTDLATTAFVGAALAALPTAGVTSFNTRVGAVTLTTADITGAGGAPISSPAFSGTPTAPTPVATDNSTRLATTAFVLGAVAASTAGVSSFNGRTGAVSLFANDVSAVGGAMLASPAFTGAPSAPTAAPGTNTTQLATTQFVTAALAAGNVVSFNGRTGAVVLSLADITGAGGAPISSPNLTGTPTAPTPATAVNDNTIATAAFVHSLVNAAAGVSSFNTRVGAVVLSAADVTGAGGALLASPTFTGLPAAPTAAPGTNTGQLATTQFVTAAVNASVLSFNGRGGAVTFQASDLSAVGGALLASPAFTGTPSAPTAVAGTSTGQLATTAFVQAAIAAGGGVLTFNGRTGAVTLTGADITGAGGALLASPALTGTPTGPTASAGTNNTQLATCAFVAAAVAAAGGVTSFNARTGAVSLTLGDVTGVGGAPIASPTFTGTPAAPTPAPGDSTTKLATTAFVATSFAPLASPALTGAPTAPTAAAHTNNTQLASTAYVDSAVAAASGTSPIFAYWAGTVNLTNFATQVASTVPASGTATMATPHGLTTGQMVNLTGTPPGVLTAGTEYYTRAISTTTFALYNSLADAKADTNRIIWAGAGVAWGIRLMSYSGVISRNFDAVCPIGALTNVGGMQFELNLSAPLPQTVNVMVLLERANGLFDNGATPTARNTWINGINPVIVNSTLIRFDRNGLQALTAAAVNTTGSWTNQGQNSFSIGIAIIA